MRDPFLQFTEQLFSKLNIRCSVQNAQEPLDENADLGLRKRLFFPLYETVLSFRGVSPSFIESNQILFTVDRFDCHYLILPIPNQELPLIFLAGPYLTERKPFSWMRRLAAWQGISASFLPVLQQYYDQLPVVENGETMELFAQTLAAQLYGENFSVGYAREDPSSPYEAQIRDNAAKEFQPEDLDKLEKRYELEEKMMDAISQGNTERAIRAIRDPAYSGSLEVRFSNTLASARHYLTVLNTLCRKAAQRGGVHPVYLDEISRRYSVEINHLGTQEKSRTLAAEMLQGYCALVRESGISGFSPIVQRIIHYISLHLEDADLTLAGLAHAFSLNKSYLASRFKRETGSTVTSFINKRRMDRAVSLLGSRDVPIQEVASACGFSDLTYFTRVFKREKGITPSDYRKNVHRKGTPR